MIIFIGFWGEIDLPKTQGFVLILGFKLLFFSCSSSFRLYILYKV